MGNNIVGIDVSKGWLDAHRLSDGASGRFSNDAAGIGRLDRWLGEVELVTFEASGGCHRRLEESLLASGRPVAKANPLHVRRFAEAGGQWAKTDALDARTLALFGQRMEPRRLAPPSASARRLRELCAARSFAVRQRVAAEQSGEGLVDETLRERNGELASLLRRQEEEIDGLIEETVRAEPALRARAERLATVPGIGATAAAGLVALMPELGTLTGGQAACLAGLAPMARESGTWHGRRSIRGGRRDVRGLLYMPAVAACRCNPDMKALYQRLKARGKPGMVALVAVMRRLLVLANALLRDGRDWTPEPPGPDQTDADGEAQDRAGTKDGAEPEPAEAGPAEPVPDGSARPTGHARAVACADAGPAAAASPAPPRGAARRQPIDATGA